MMLELSMIIYTSTFYKRIMMITMLIKMVVDLFKELTFVDDSKDEGEAGKG